MLSRRYSIFLAEIHHPNPFVITVSSRHFTSFRKIWYVYPSFIDPFTDYGQPESKPPTRANRRERGAQVESATPGAYHWNQAIRSEIEAYMYFTVDEKRAMELRTHRQEVTDHVVRRRIDRNIPSVS